MLIMLMLEATTSTLTVKEAINFTLLKEAMTFSLEATTLTVKEAIIFTLEATTLTVMEA